MQSENVWVAHPQAVLREEFDDWAVLYNPETAAAFGTNPVGVAIWKLIDGKRSEEQIFTALAAQFDETPERMRQDVSEFIIQLHDNGFIGTTIEQS